MKFVFCKVFLCIMLLFSSWFVSAQPLSSFATDSLISEQITAFTGIEQSNIYDSDGFINGIVFPYQGTRNINPFFQDNNWRKGILIMDNRSYSIDMMRYNIELDQLVVLLNKQSAAFPVILDQKVISQFFFEEINFVYMDTMLKSGYYEKISKHNCNIYIKWSKRKSINRVQGEMYSTYQKIIIERNGSFYPINRLAQLYELYPSCEKDMKHFKKRNGLIFRDNPLKVVNELIGVADVIIKENEGI